MENTTTGAASVAPATAAPSIRALQAYVWETMEAKGFHKPNEDTERMDTMARLAFVHLAVTNIVQTVKRTWDDCPTGQQWNAFTDAILLLCKDIPALARLSIVDPARVGILARLSLIHTEVSEASELIGIKGEIDKTKFGEELSDIVIRCLDLAETEHIDLQDAILAKMEKNTARPFRYGTADAKETASGNSN